MNAERRPSRQSDLELISRNHRPERPSPLSPHLSSIPFSAMLWRFEAAHHHLPYLAGAPGDLAWVTDPTVSAGGVVGYACAPAGAWAAGSGRQRGPGLAGIARCAVGLAGGAAALGHTARAVPFAAQTCTGSAASMVLVRATAGRGFNGVGAAANRWWLGG